MTLYLIIIVAANIVIDVVYVVFVCGIWYEIVLWTAFSTLVAFVIDLLLAVFIRKMPEKLFRPEKKIFTIYDFEKNLYEKTGIKFYKDKIPELGKYSGFRKNHVAEPKNPQYLYRFMTECCYGEVIHLVSVPLGFISMFCMPKALWLTSGVYVAIVNAILCILPYFVLRYNRKKLSVLYKFATRKKDKIA